MLKNPDIKFTRESARRFMALLSNTQGLASLLRRLHEMKVLRKIIPDFEHARGLLQFNEYHIYTVDEHSLRALENVIRFESDHTTVGKTYQKIRDKNILHLAILLHDLGKGYAEDHSEVGRRIAAETGERFDLTDEETETIKFLVHNHLVMSHLALHRDINDAAMVAEFASNVGSVQMLSMLYVLTCADISAVGPGVLNQWKQGLLTDLFLHAKQVLSGDADGVVDRQFEQLYDMVAIYSDDEDEQKWLREKAKALPINYCALHSPELISQQLIDMRDVSEQDALCQVNAMEDSDLFEICIGKISSRRTGIFYKITGMLSSLGLQIRSADIKPLGDSLMFYWIQFEDTEFETPPPSRLEDIRKRALELVLDIDNSPPKFRSVWKKEDSVALKLSRPEIRVKIDNETVSSATIIDVFAYDKTGLLYKLAKKLHRLGLDVTYARISTYAHQVIDVFYVTDEQGNKIRNRNQIQLIKKEVFRAAKDFLEPPETSAG